MPAPPPLPGGPRGPAAVTDGPIEAGDSKQFRTAARIGRWTVGQVFEGVVEPEGAPCTIVFPDVVGADVVPWLAAMRAEVQGNRALVGLPIAGWIYAGQTVDRRVFAVLPPLVGKALDAHVAETGPLDTLAALQLGVELADALTRAHGRGRCLGELAPAAVRLPTERAERLSVVDVGGGERAASSHNPAGRRGYALRVAPRGGGRYTAPGRRCLGGRRAADLAPRYART